MSENNQIEGLQPLLIDGKALAQMIGMSNRWVEINRYRIIGSQRVGGAWRYNLNMIRAAIASGKNIVI
jgi:hypothetical protein